MATTGEPKLSLFTRIIPRRGSWIDLAVLLFVGVVLYGIVGVAREWRAPLQAAVEIDLSLSALPRYTFFSLCRGLVAFALSFLFTLVYGYVAARVRYADKVMLPLLDILQSIPVLGFMPGVVLALAALFPTTNIGLELAAVIMIFTGQVWNMTFSFYHSLRSIPPDLLDAGRIYRFGWWRRFRQIELPFSTVGLVWNGMMSMAGGWFFLTVNEAFRLGSRDFRLPGVGAYMSVAIDQGDRGAMVGAVVAMIVMIVVLDQLMWRPLVAWSERFKLEDIGASTVAHSWLLDLIRRSQLYVWIGQIAQKLRDRAEGGEGQRARPQTAESPAGPPKRLVGKGIGLAILVGLAAGCIWGTAKLVRLLLELDAGSWTAIARASAYTLVRTTAAVGLGTLWAVPAGIYIGQHPRASRFLQPVVQVAASFPAPMLFPIVLLVLDRFGVPLGVGSVALMMLGTQWYILFNVIAGAMSIPHDLVEAAEVYRLSRKEKWRKLLIPGVFRHLVTGWVTAAGGAWNASIVSEYVHSAGTIKTADGLGALISSAADQGAFPLLAAGVLTMAAVVVLINRLFWKRLYGLAERRYALSR